MPDKTDITDRNGKFTFGGLKPGLYLVVRRDAAEGNEAYVEDKRVYSNILYRILHNPKKALRKRKAFFIMIAALCECLRFAADFNPSQRLFLFCRRNARTFIVIETVAYMQLPIKVSSKIIS